MKKETICCALICLTMLLVGCQKKECATSLYATRNSPIIYNGILYFYSEDMTIEYGNTSSKGITLRSPGGFLSNIEKRELYYDVTDARRSILVSNENNLLCNYISQNRIEEAERTDKIMELYDDFLIEKQVITYRKNGTDEIVDAETSSEESLDKGIVKKLEEKYGEVKYNINDFENIEELFFIKAGCVDNDIFLKKYTERGYFAVGDFYDTEIPEIFVGIIIKKDDNYYYGNLKNEIPDDLIKELLDE